MSTPKLYCRMPHFPPTCELGSWKPTKFPKFGQIAGFQPRRDNAPIRMEFVRDRRADRQLRSSPSVSDLSVPAPATSSHSVNSPLSPSITPSLFHSGSNLPLPQIFPTIDFLSGPRTDSTDFITGPFLLSILILFFSFLQYSFCLLVLCGRLSWLFVSFWVHINIVYHLVS